VILSSWSAQRWSAARAPRSLQRRELARKVRQVLFRDDLATSRYSKGSLHETYRDRLFARPNYQRLNVIRPFRQRVTHLAFVSCAIVDASNASLMTAHMIKHCLDNVRLHAKLGHASGARAPKIVEPPLCNA
jgi:hypothetical protein